MLQFHRVAESDVTERLSNVQKGARGCASAHLRQKLGMNLPEMSEPGCLHGWGVTRRGGGTL